MAHVPRRRLNGIWRGSLSGDFREYKGNSRGDGQSIRECVFTLQVNCSVGTLTDFVHVAIDPAMCRVVESLAHDADGARPLGHHPGLCCSVLCASQNDEECESAKSDVQPAFSQGFNDALFLVLRARASSTA